MCRDVKSCLSGYLNTEVSRGVQKMSKSVEQMSIVCPAVSIHRGV